MPYGGWGLVRSASAGPRPGSLSALSQAAAEALEKRNAITSDNIGHKLLSKMGWKEGEAVGASK